MENVFAGYLTKWKTGGILNHVVNLLNRYEMCERELHYELP